MIDWLTDTFVATSVLLGIVLLAREPVRRHFGPSVAYGLWLIPTLRLLMPPLVETVERTVPPVPLSRVPIESTLAMPMTQPGLFDQVGGWQTLALAVWLAGVAAMLLGGIFLYRWQRREVLRDSVQLALLGNVRIVRSAAIGGPMAFGIVDRVIALPVDFESRFNENERRLAFDHELSHHRSGDLIVSHVAFALLCLQWFSPLAWLCHDAFRFDQEAACDARVLGKVKGGNRAAYAQAITKAASGRALLFAGALDRPRTLHRRLASMLSSPSTGRRFAGQALIALIAAAAMPLTASRATQYVDVPAPQPPTTAAQVGTAPASAAPAELVPAAAPVASNEDTAGRPYPDLGGVTLGKGDVAYMGDDTILMDGTRKNLDQLTPAQRSKLRATIAKSRSELAKEREELPARLAEAQQELDKVRSGDFKRELLQDREDLRRDLSEIDSEAAELRASGEDPAKRKAEILSALREIDAVDIDKRVAEALEEANPARIAAELRSAEQQMERLLAKLDQLDRR